MAAAVVEQLFPPSTTNEVAQIVTALNLLNAIVKLEAGKQFTSYNYIKGMVSCLFVWLLYHPIEDVEMYWDEAENVTYIRVDGVQYSFHRVPIVRYYVGLCKGEGLTVIEWDGVQRQAVAAELFRSAVGTLPEVTAEDGDALILKMRYCTVRKIIQRINGLDGVTPYIKLSPPPTDTPSTDMKTSGKKSPPPRRQSRVGRIRKLRKFVERHLSNPNLTIREYGQWKQQAEQWRHTDKDHLFCLTLSLKFNGWWEQQFEISRKGDFHVYRVMAYTGDNYGSVVKTLMGKRPLTYIRPEKLMRRGWHYFISRTNWSWIHMTYTRYLLMMGHNSNLNLDGSTYNLCITYGLARYLASAYPQLRFINVLNFTRFKVHRRVYSAKDLQKVGLHSKSRTLKVWMVVDPMLLLGDLDVEGLPQGLIAEYRQAPDYADFFTKVYHRGRVGLVAYSHFHLLPTIYREITINGHYAHVLNDKGKWAIYSLIEEAFETEFIFDAIYFDPYLFLVVGCKGAERIILHDMFNPL